MKVDGNTGAQTELDVGARRLFEKSAWPGCSPKQVAQRRDVLIVSSGKERTHTVSSVASGRPMLVNRHSSSAGSRRRTSKIISSDSTDRTEPYAPERAERS